MEDEDLFPDEKPQAAATPPMSNSDMLGMALVTLAPALFGGMMGGTKGALAGGAAGAGAASGALKDMAAEDAKKADKAAAKEEELETHRKKKEIDKEVEGEKPKEPKTESYTDAKGNKRKGKVGADGFVVKTETDPIMEPFKAAPPPKDISVNERNTLQNHYDRNPSIRKNKAVMDAYQDAQALAAEKGPAADHALLLAYFKANDPGSVVKETEAEIAKGFGGLEKRAEAWYKSNVTGEAGMTDEQRKDLVNQIKILAKTAAKKQDVLDNDFKGHAKQRGVNDTELMYAPRPTFEDDAPPPPPDAGVGAKQTARIPATPENIAKAKARLEQLRKEKEQAAAKTTGNGG